MTLLRGLLVAAFWACLVMWLAHRGWLGRLVSPWHEYVPFVFWTVTLTLWSVNAFMSPAVHSLPPASLEVPSHDPA